MSNYFPFGWFSFGWMLDWINGWMSDLTQTGQFIAAIISLGFLVVFIYIVKKHEKEYKQNSKQVKH